MTQCSLQTHSSLLFQTTLHHIQTHNLVFLLAQFFNINNLMLIRRRVLCITLLYFNNHITLFLSIFYRYVFPNGCGRRNENTLSDQTTRESNPNHHFTPPPRPCYLVNETQFASMIGDQPITPNK